MKIRFFILFVLCFVLSVRTGMAQTASSCKPDSLLIKAYAMEISSMALIRLYAIKSPDTVLIGIPQIHKDSIISGLSAITHLALYEPSIDSIFNKYCLHSDVYFNGYNAVEINTNTKYEWTKKWKDSIMTTGYGALDSLLARYGGKLNRYTEYSSHNIIARIFFDSLINIKAMADSLEYLNGVDYTYQLQNTGAAVYFSYKRDSVQHFGFSHGWEDCMMGCIFGRYWGFKVDDACTVSLEKYSLRNDDRARQPEFLNCNYFPLLVRKEIEVNRSMLVYPNPSSHNINIQGMATADYSISDISGRILQTGKISGTNPISIESLAAGIYCLKMVTPEGAINRSQFVKY